MIILNDKEKVDFWYKVSPTLSKLAEDSLTEAYEWKVQRDVEEERRKIRELDPTIQREYLDKASELLTTSNIVDLQNSSLAVVARSAGAVGLADYLKGLNGLGLKIFTMKLAEQELTEL